MLHKEALCYAPRKKVFSLNTLMQRLTWVGEISAHRIQGNYFEIGNPSRLKRARESREEFLEIVLPTQEKAMIPITEEVAK